MSKSRISIEKEWEKILPLVALRFNPDQYQSVERVFVTTMLNTLNLIADIEMDKTLSDSDCIRTIRNLIEDCKAFYFGDIKNIRWSEQKTKATHPIPIGRRLLYFDSQGRLDEVVRNDRGEFSRIKAFPDHEHNT